MLFKKNNSQQQQPYPYQGQSYGYEMGFDQGYDQGFDQRAFQPFAMQGQQGQGQMQQGQGQMPQGQGQQGMGMGQGQGGMQGQQQGQQGLQVPPMPSQQSPSQSIPGMLPLEESYIENILRLNRGKLATVYMTFENNKEWNAMIFKGNIEAAGRDHIILSDPQSGRRFLLLMVYLDYITFDEEINYEYPFGMATYSPR
ncbi:spore coat protein GerQ [Bacillus mangrovi]|uniref:Spore coat protein GerQ n=1 Tax=Metabacillus mangrovi TaxID=1491830 RepID=A0A7X2S9B7_9BACI|nr:spore coat protein GerQ [Metabacillus mangrovi]MTH55790.1 spore coat protein GerQ [Metabacillus mangrovi]